ncbi:exopolysaccharide biosynthesis polyprenyl glycosylphosphotransferase [Asanoa hainanensis]|uniref:Exopolysaccharide biosynthesis polyprenyl glycosylphosphotransferase n=1 Tax=Asanoa hainanensis TaxID=560556 RepID=A0A239GTP1_9ACTN|nr:sugar transferase [Asanoa hainanensis]SNS72500.1 exopolysaccharide biosynthesis polyprenyl glycosylphosphotransferase [Asanoa hainanensis]
MATQSQAESDSDVVVPAQRSPGDDAVPGGGWATAPTTVLPYVGSPASTRTRRLRAWMVTAPFDLAALVAPLLWTIQYWRGTLTMAGLTIVFFAFGGLYSARRHVSFLDELPILIGRMLASGAVVAIVAALRHESVYYVTGFVRGLALAGCLVLAGRVVSRSLILLARHRRWVEHNTIIVGAGPIAVEMARLLRRDHRYGLRFVGHVDNAPRPGGPPLLGDLESLEQAIALAECDVLILSHPECPESTLMEMLRRPAASACDLWAVPHLWGSRSHVGGMADHIGAIPVIHVRHTTLSGPRWWVKRASDIAVALVGLVVLSPVMLLCAVAVFVEGGRGVLFRQERLGHRGLPFQVIKFRSMRPASDTESRTAWTIAGDHRIGPVGRFLRRTSLDELPQLWNILRGDMTVVGPRPERPYFAEKFSAEHPDYARRHRVPAGLTGLAQVSGLRGDVPISDRARYDNYYIENWSLWLDAKVMVRTIGEVFRGGGR